MMPEGQSPIEWSLFEDWKRMREDMGMKDSLLLPVFMEDIIRRYREPHRRYHTLTHLVSCFVLAREVRATTEDPAALALALFYHDAVYDPTRTDNEHESMLLMRTRMLASGASERTVALAEAAIRATGDRHVAHGALAAYVCDIDLAILAAPNEEYALYEERIRSEYRHVPREDFIRRRLSWIAGMLDRSRLPIFQTPHFRRRFELRALRNLKHSARALRASAQALRRRPAFTRTVGA